MECYCAVSSIFAAMSKARLTLSPQRKADSERVQKGYYMLQYGSSSILGSPVADREEGGNKTSSSRSKTIVATPVKRSAATSSSAVSLKGRKQLITLKTFKVLSEGTKLYMQKALLQIVIIYRHNHYYKRKYHYLQRWYISTYRQKHADNLTSVIAIKDGDIKLLRDTLARSDLDHRSALEVLSSSHIEEIESINTADDEASQVLHNMYQKRITDLAHRADGELMQLREQSRSALSSSTLHYEAAIANLNRLHDVEMRASQDTHNADIETCRRYYETSAREIRSTYDRAMQSGEDRHVKVTDDLRAIHEATLAASVASHQADIERLAASYEIQLASMKTSHALMVRNLNENTSRVLLMAYTPKLSLLNRLHGRLSFSLLKKRSFWTLWRNTIAHFSSAESLICRHKQHLHSLASKFSLVRRRESRLARLNYYFNLYRRNIFYTRMSDDLRDMTERLMHLEKLEDCVERDVTAEMKRLNPRFDLRHLPQLLLHYKFKSYNIYSQSHSLRNAVDSGRIGIGAKSHTPGLGLGGDINYHMTYELRRVAYENLRLYHTMGVLVNKIPDHTSLLTERGSTEGVGGDVIDIDGSSHAGSSSGSPVKNPRIAEVESIRQLLEQHQRSYGAANTYISSSILRQQP